MCDIKKALINHFSNVILFHKVGMELFLRYLKKTIKINKNEPSDSSINSDLLNIRDL